MTSSSQTSSLFSEFAGLCQELAATGSKLQKRARIASYLQRLSVDDAARAVLYLAGSPFAATDQRQLNVGASLLSRLLAERTGAGREVMHEAYRRHGDLGGAAFDLLSATGGGPAGTAELTLAQLEEAFAAVAAEAKPAAKGRVLSSLLERTAPIEAKYLIKIVLGDLRIGVKESLVEEAIAAAYNAPLGQVRHATMLNGSLAEVVQLAAHHRLHAAQMKLFHPLGFMLASPVDSVEEAILRFGQEQSLEADGSETPGNAVAGAETSAVANEDASSTEPSRMRLLGAQADRLSGAQLEDKYDGIRAQIHCGDPDQPQRVAIFSRSRENMTESFPEIVEAFAGFSQSAILDGEILAWAPQTAGSGGRALPFTSLQPRLGRKRINAEICEKAPVVFVAFDLLWLDGELLFNRPLADRREALEALVEREAPGTIVGSRGVFLGRQSQLPFASPRSEDAFARLVLSPIALLRDAVQLEQAYGDARARGNEGIMLKSRRSAYQPGRRGLAWLKLKRELATLDVVVTAAEYGHGKRAGRLSDYTFAVRDGSRFRNVGKAYSGLTDAEIENLTRFFKQHTMEDRGFVRTVEPLIVLEVAFNNVMQSDRHDSGFALRFPRIVRIRDDKPVMEIDTLERVAEIYHSQERPATH